MTQDESASRGPSPKKLDSEPDGQSPADWRVLIWFLFMALLGYWLFRGTFQAAQNREISYSQFKTYLGQGAVTECELHETYILGSVDPGKVKPGESSTSEAQTPASESPEAEDETATEPFEFRTNRVDDPELIAALQAAEVDFDGAPPSIATDTLISWAIIIGLMVVMWRFLSRRMASAERGVMGFGKSRAKLVADKNTGVTFDDVAGCDEAKYELQEVVDFLQHPDKYTRLGAKIPKGVLLVGPPGTGKTLLARAVAGQAGVPFFSLSGSDCVEMFVGVGAARVRDLFQQATRSAPCIVFIDELDAIGRQRGVHVGSVNDEREHTLNQLLVELDGFETNLGVIILAATNRPDVLDRALLRPGRFDRQVVLDAPDVEGRQAILAVHARDKPLDDEVDLSTVAKATPGFSGADLANVMNEAALLSARQQSDTISQANIEEAVEKVVAGPERKSRRLEPDEKRRVAYHEVGHALVGYFSKYADPVHKISIVPRGRAALGYTLQLPTGDRFLLTRSELIDRMRGLLGGRAAEEIKYGEVSTGAENDLERATAMARQMVSMYGMSDKVGLSHCGRRELIWATDPDDPMQSDGAGRLDCSPETANLIDEEVKSLLGGAYEDAKRILTEHRDQLERVTEKLLEKETLDAGQLRALLSP